MIVAVRLTRSDNAMIASSSGSRPPISANAEEIPSESWCTRGFLEDASRRICFVVPAQAGTHAVSYRCGTTDEDFKPRWLWVPPRGDARRDSLRSCGLTSVISRALRWKVR